LARCRNEKRREMTEEEYEFGVSVFIQGEHVITVKGTESYELTAMEKAYRLGAGVVEDISMTIFTIGFPNIPDNVVAGFCIRNLGEYRTQMDKARWYHRGGFHTRYFWFY